jgi:L-asparagine transporter-like permease
MTFTESNPGPINSHPGQAGNEAARAAAVENQEVGLKRKLTSGQVSMIALGGAIGTGLFLGSALSVRAAGPGVILSYAAGAAIAMLVMWALAEMAVAHPVAGSFGVYAEIYLHPWAGFVMRYSYWLAQVVAIGSEMVAVSIYLNKWMPGVPSWIWILTFSVSIVYVNALSVANFGFIEYWFAAIKVVAIVLFIVLGAAMLFGVGFTRVGAANYTAHGGFLPHGWAGVGLGITLAIFSYLGTEIVAVTAGEAGNPKQAVPRALRQTLGRLALFYIGGIAILVGVLPWNQVGLTESPFVRVFLAAGISKAAIVMNIVVLTAALSSVNCNLYLTSRMIFSLSRGGYAPRAFGKLTRKGVPLAALLVSSAGMGLALLLNLYYSATAFVYMIGAAFFGGLFVWIMIMVTHLRFRRHAPEGAARFAPRGPWSTLIGLAALIGVMISTWWVPGFRITLWAGLPWLAFISLCYFAWTRWLAANPRRAE